MDFIFDLLMRHSCYYLPISHNGTSIHAECRTQSDPGLGLKVTVKNGFKLLITDKMRPNNTNKRNVNSRN